MFPNSSNTSFELLTIATKTDLIGNKINYIKKIKRVIGSKRSITSQEYQNKVSLNLQIEFKIVIQALVYDGSKFARLNNQIYKIERTFQSGQFLELYLSLTDIKVDELNEY